MRNSCARKTVTCVAAIFSGDVCIYTTYHHNMRLWNGTQHAEKTTLEDEASGLPVQSHPGCRLVLYITYNPCHFSGGHRVPHNKSCTDHILAFKAQYQIEISIKISYTYRAHWRTNSCNCARPTPHLPSTGSWRSMLDRNTQAGGSRGASLRL